MSRWKGGKIMNIVLIELNHSCDPHNLVEDIL